MAEAYHINTGLLNNARRQVRNGQLEALAHTLLMLWESAAVSSVQHQDVLAILEHAARVRCQDGPMTDEQKGLCERGLRLLGLPEIARTDADSLRTASVKAGLKPLCFMV